MEATRTKTGDVESIQFLALDVSGAPITGVTDLMLSIRRVSDEMLLDFDDDTFKADSWTTPSVALTEVDSTNAPGWYSYTFDSSTLTNPLIGGDTYVFMLVQTPGITVSNVPATGELKVGGYIDRLLGLVNENTFIDSTVFNEVGQMVSCRIRVFDTKAHVESATDGGTETAGLMATYTMAAEYRGVTPPMNAGNLKTYRYKLG